jgi:hypothetical protein
VSACIASYHNVVALLCLLLLSQTSDLLHDAALRQLHRRGAYWHALPRHHGGVGADERMGQLIKGDQRLFALVLSDRIVVPNRGSTECAQASVLVSGLGLPIGACTCHASQQKRRAPFAALCRHCTHAPMLSHEGPSSAAMRHQEPPGTDCHRPQGCHHVTDSRAGWSLLLHGRAGDMPHH